MTDDEKKELEELRWLNCFLSKQFYVTLNMNDTFGWACADTEDMPVWDIKKFLPVFMKYKHDATNAYAAVKRGCDVMDHPKLRTPEYYLAKAEIEQIKNSTKYYMQM